MATRINNLPAEVSPSPSANLAIDAATTKRTTIQAVVDAGAPVTSEADALAGSDNNGRMTALRVKQFVDAQIGTTLASAAQGELAQTALQPGDLSLEVPIYPTAQGLAATEVPVTFNSIRVNGFTTENDGMGGLYVSGTGTGYRGFTSDGGARGWDYVPPELPESVEINVGLLTGDFIGISGIQEAYAAANQLIKSTKSVTINLNGHFSKSTAGYTLRADSPSGRQIKIRGITPVQTTLVSIDSVTGSSGAWNVTATVASAAGVVAGDFIRLKNIVPGYRSIYTYSGVPFGGEMWMPRVNLGKIYTSGSTAIVNGSSALNTHLSQNDIVILKGQARRVAAIDSATNFTMATGGLVSDIASDPRLNWWWFVRASGNGFVQVTGTSVVGTGTAFMSRLNPGDYIAVQNGSVGRIASIASDTALTLERPMDNTPASRYWAPIIRGHHHEGGWRITNVVGNQITWVNTSRSSYPPPVNRVLGADITVLKSSIQDSGAGSAIMVDNFIDIDNVALAGDLGTGQFAIVAYGDGRGKAGVVRMGPGMITLGYQYGFYGEMGALYANNVAFCGATVNGCHPLNGTTVTAVDAVANGNLAKGFTSYGAYAQYTGCRALGNGNDGFWPRLGQTLAESVMAEDNGRGGIWNVGGSSCEAVQARLMGNQYGVVSENSNMVRFSGAFIAANKEQGITNLGGTMEGTDATVVLNGDGETDDAGYYARSTARTSIIQAGFYKNSVANTDVDSVAVTDETFVTKIP